MGKARISKQDLIRSGAYPDEIETCDVCGNACVGRERVAGKDVCDDCRAEYENENPTWEQVKADLEGY